MRSPAIIVGAGRSGTNALRDALCELDQFHTWPCDEINYIWRHGNRRFPTDQMSRQNATVKATAYIRDAFARRSALVPDATLIEKTCANSLRVAFVHEVFPNARFIHIIRDGRDVTASAMSRWTAELDIRYLAAKGRFVPRSDLPFYAYQYFLSRISKLRSVEDRLSWWGPKFKGMQDLAASPLEVVAAVQWERCVSLAFEQLSEVPPAQVATVRYQDLVGDSYDELSRIANFLGEMPEESDLQRAARTLHADSKSTWREKLSQEQIELIAPIVAPALELIESQL